jgi:type IV secretion system protein VirB6
MGGCSPVPAGAGFISSMTSFLDCQSQVLGSGAWSALAAPGSTLSIVLTGFLTIFIAMVGYNLLLGHSVSARSVTLAIVKLGAVFALATSWPAYRTLVYDVVTNGPGQLVLEIGPQTGVVGSDGTLTQRLDLVDRAMARLAILGPGIPPPNTSVQVPPPPFGGFDAFALGGSRIVFELTAVGALGIVRILAGLMLALGPFFIAFLMFDSTRSLFEGWVRVLGGAALAAIGIAITLGLELALVEPWLANALARRMAGEALPTISTELFVIACLFAMLVAASLYGCARVTHAFRLPRLLGAVPVATHEEPTRSSSTLIQRGQSGDGGESERSRAAAVASVLASANRRDRMSVTSSLTGAASSGRAPIMGSSIERPFASTPVGRTFTRRAQSRVSALAAKRDHGA